MPQSQSLSEWFRVFNFTLELSLENIPLLRKYNYQVQFPEIKSNEGYWRVVKEIEETESWRLITDERS